MVFRDAASRSAYVADVGEGTADCGGGWAASYGLSALVVQADVIVECLRSL